MIDLRLQQYAEYLMVPKAIKLAEITKWEPYDGEFIYYTHSDRVLVAIKLEGNINFKSSLIHELVHLIQWYKSGIKRTRPLGLSNIPFSIDKDEILLKIVGLYPEDKYEIEVETFGVEEAFKLYPKEVEKWVRYHMMTIGVSMGEADANLVYHDYVMGIQNSCLECLTALNNYFDAKTKAERKCHEYVVKCVKAQILLVYMFK